jgi:nucleolar MIF4G domain-containing protein 1
MDGFSDLDSDEDMMDLGSEDEDINSDGGFISLEEEEENDGEADNSLDDLGSEDDDLAQFFSEGEGDSEEDEELRRNTESNARTEQPEMSVPPPVLAPIPSTGKYIPPSLRKLQQTAAGSSGAAVAGPSTPSQSGIKPVEPLQKTEQQIKLERKIQGLLNKLSEANIESILGDVEALYREWSRNGEWQGCRCYRSQHS